MSEKESRSTKIARRVADAEIAMAERVFEELMTPRGGTQELSRRSVRANLRKMIRDGDDAAEEFVIRLALENGHQDGEEIPCPVCEEAYIIWQELYQQEPE